MAFLLLAAGIIGAYSLGWTGSFHFDDEVNLAGLQRFQSTGDWLTWVTGGLAGPGGRGIALGSFLLDGLNWPHSPAPFLVTNTLIHAVNGLLVALVFLQLSRQMGSGPSSRVYAPLIAAILWMSLPILVSTSLLVIQRMTLLAATFMLLGFLVYLIGRSIIFRRPWRGAALMWLGVIAGTLLGFFSKQNAALLPLLILITELTVLSVSRPALALAWRTTFWFLLVLPSLFIFGYLAWSVQLGGFGGRDFTLGERLSTQGVILWEYLHLAFFPKASAFTPFHDDYPIYGLPWADSVAALAAISWVTLVGIATLLWRRAPLFAFAVYWYLGAHLIESTVIPLELYFEHRNYVPLVGPVFALVVGVGQLAHRLNARKVIWGASVAYLVVIGTVLAQTTSLWGQPALAAEIWYLDNEGSKRASQYLAQTYISQGDANAALRVLTRNQQLQPDSGGIALQRLQIACQVAPLERQREVLREAKELMRSGRIEAPVLETLKVLKNFAVRGECEDVLTIDTVQRLAERAVENPQIQGGNMGRVGLLVFLTEMYIEARDFGKTMAAIESAIQLRPDLYLLKLGVATLNSGGLYEEGLHFGETYAPLPPRNPLLRRQWTKELKALLEPQRRVVAELQIMRGENFRRSEEVQQ